MSKFVALKSGNYEILADAWNSDFSNLKQQALLFDQIGIFHLSRLHKILEESTDLFKKLIPDAPNKAESIIMELEWLQKLGVVFEPTMQDEFQNLSPERFPRNGSGQKIDDVKNLLRKIIEIQTSDLKNVKDQTHKLDLIKEQHFTILRLMSIVMETTKGVTAVTTFPYSEYARELPNSSKSDVVEITIKKLPLPNNETPWEQIIDYRNDPENQKSLLNLRRWIRKISCENLSPAEIEDELEGLINDFQNHMKVHKIKANTEALEVIAKAPLELLELNFSKIIEPLFALKKRQVNLMEAELNAPGREMAYVIKTQGAFQPNE